MIDHFLYKKIQFIGQKLLLITCIFLLLSACQTKEVQNPLFEKISIRKSGITFKNTLNPSDSINVLTYEYFYNGSGIGVADFNKDGKMDLVFAANDLGTHVYINKGEFTFENLGKDSGIDTEGIWVNGVSIVDINHDGWPDIYLSVAGPGPKETRKNLLYVHQGLGLVEGDSIPYFKEEASVWGLDLDDRSVMAYFFDYNQDGLLDLFLINHGSTMGPQAVVLPTGSAQEDGKDRLLAQIEPGKFVDLSDDAKVNFGGYALSAIIRDFNQDKLLDMYVANDYIFDDRLFIQQTNHSFREEIRNYLRQSSHFSMGSDAADIDNDGKIDFFILDMLPEDRYRRHQLGGNLSYDQHSLFQRQGLFPKFMRNSLQWNRGPSGFAEISRLAGVSASDWSWSALFADFDNDGWNDLFVTNGYGKNITDRDFITYTVPTFGKKGQNAIQEALKELEEAPLLNKLYHNTGQLRFSDQSENWGFTEKSISHGAVYVDLNNDGRLDLVTNNFNEEAFIFRNQGHKGNFITLSLEANEAFPSLVGTSIRLVLSNGMELIREYNPYRGYLSSVDPRIHFGLGLANEIKELIIQWPNGKIQVLQNLPANQFISITYDEKLAKAESSKDTDKKTWLSKVEPFTHIHRPEKENDYSIQPGMVFQYSAMGPTLAIGDINGDGMDDFYIGGTTGLSGQFFIQQAPGSFESKAWEVDSDYHDQGVILVDLDLDGDLDMYVCSGGFAFPQSSHLYQDRIYWNDGKGNFTVQKEGLPSTSTQKVIAADFRGSGQLDLMVFGRVKPGQYPKAPPSYFIENQGGQFSITEKNDFFESLGMVSDALIIDANEDGMPDVLVVGEYMAPTLLLNKGNGKFEKQAFPQHTDLHGWWFSLFSEDIKGNGESSLFFGNFGENHQWNPKDADLSLHYSNKKEVAALSFMFTQKEKGVEYPLIDRDLLIKQNPAMGRIFRSYADYSSSDWKNVAKRGNFVPNHSLRANTFSNFIWNKQEGFQKLPISLQRGPILSMVRFHPFGSTQSALLVAGNFHETMPTQGYQSAMDGDILYWSQEKEYLVPPEKKGVHLSGDHRSLGTLYSSDGTELLIATQYAGKTEVYSNIATKGLPSYSFDPLSLWAHIHYTIEEDDGKVIKKRKFLNLTYSGGFLGQSSRKIPLTEDIIKIEEFGFDGQIIRNSSF